MRITNPLLKRLYHGSLRVLLPLAGMDFGWYQTFFVDVIFGVPLVEPFLQLTRSRRQARAIFGDGDPLRFVKPGDTVLDFGANVGRITSCLLSLELKVHAYEPDSRCVEMIRRRFSLYGGKRLQLHHCAVSHEDGEVTLNYGTLTTESNSIVPGRSGAGGHAGGEVTEAVDIRRILREHDYVPLVKMDIEGAEYEVLDAMLEPEMIDRFGVCLVEVHANKIPSLKPAHAALVEKIEKLGVGDRILLTWH
ncbi:MAG: FkbM family methyltransferase [Alphaproteobacteria bacterium]